MMGGAEMFIDGMGYHEVPSSNAVRFQFRDSEFEATGTNFTGPALTENDEFSSETIGGKLAYTSPSIEELINVPIDQLW